MGGVINLVHAPLPYAADGRRIFRGALTSGLSRGASEWSGQMRLEGAFGAVGWRGDLVRRDSGDITTPAGVLDNTDSTQTNAMAMAGYGGAWGSARARWHHWEDQTGFYRPAGFRLGLTDNLVAGDVHLASRAGVVELLAGLQQNRRRAFEVPGAPATLDLDLSALTLRAALRHAHAGGLQGEAAVEYRAVDNDTRVGTLVPDYKTDCWAAMLFEEARLWPAAGARHDRLILSAGVRADVQSLEVARAQGPWTAGYSAVTGSFGAVFRVHEHAAVAGSVGRGWRPPSAFELFASGLHGGVAAYQLGNPDLGSESNLNAEAAIRLQGRVVQASVTAYRNAFRRYIYLADSGERLNNLPVFVHRPANATIAGVEAAASVVPTRWLRLDAAWTNLATRNEDTDRRLPQTPPNRVIAGAALRRASWKALRDLSVGLDAAFVGAGKVSGPDEPLGTPTAAYRIVDLHAGAAVPAGRTTFEVSAAVRNVFDSEYRDFLWSYKPYAPNPGRDVRLSVTWRF